MKFDKGIIKYETGGVHKTIEFFDMSNLEEAGIRLDIRTNDIRNGEIYSIRVEVDKKCILDKIELNFDFKSSYFSMFSNGYQSMSESREYIKLEKMKKISKINQLRGLDNYGDYKFVNYVRKKGFIHSIGYTYLKSFNSTLFTASLNDDNGFTVFYGDIANKKIKVVKDLVGTEIKHSFDAIRIIMSYDTVDFWRHYSRFVTGKNVENRKISIWRSLGRYGKVSNSRDIIENLEKIYEEKIPYDIIQIDSGYEKKLGDWMDFSKEFPEGLKKIAYRIREKGYTPGIWIAPFVCSTKSNLYRKHNEWILRNNHNNEVVAGKDLVNGDKLYAIDILNVEFREYLKKVFDYLVDCCKFEFINVDYVYASCMIPCCGKNRGMILSEAIKMIDEFSKNSKVMLSGTPLVNAFKKTEYCSVSCIYGFSWENQTEKNGYFKERRTAYNSLVSTLNRYKLNSTMFNSSSGVSTLKSKKSSLNKHEKYSMLFISYLMSNVIMNADNISAYNDIEKHMIKSLYPLLEIEINHMEIIDNVYKIEFKYCEFHYEVYFNSNDVVKTSILRRDCFNRYKEDFKKATIIDIIAHETRYFIIGNKDKISNWNHLIVN